MASLRLASFKTGGRASYGAVTDQGIVDLGKKLTKYPTLLDVLRAQAVGEARAAASGAADQLKDVTMLPPIPRRRRTSASASTIRTAAPSTKTAR